MDVDTQSEASRRTDITIVLIGTIGSGKSRTGNTIIGSDKFKHAFGSIPVTEKMNYSEVDINQLHLTVFDIPGLQRFEEFGNYQKEIKRLSRGVCVYLFVIPIGRFRSEEKILLEGLFKSKTDIGYRTGIVLTRLAELGDQTLDQWITDVPTLKKVINHNHLQYQGIDNADNDGKPRECLIKLITELHSRESPLDANKVISVSYREMKEWFGNAGVNYFNKKYEEKMKEEYAKSCLTVKIPFFH